MTLIVLLILHQIYETVETINQLKINREFFLGFARNPQVIMASDRVTVKLVLTIY